MAYLLAMLIPAVMLIGKRVNLRPAGFGVADLRMLPVIVRRGITNAVSQLGSALKFGFCNALAAKLGGADGIVAMAVCAQTISIATIGVGGVCDATVPILAMLKGQEAYADIKVVLRRAAWVLEILACGLFALFEFFPQGLLGMYNVASPGQVAMSGHAVMIFSLCYPLRCPVIMFMNYVNVFKRTVYSVFISAFDGFAGIIAIALVLTSFLGLDGIWWTFPVDAVLLTLVIICVNMRILRRESDKYQFLWLIPREDPDIRIASFTYAYEGKMLTSANDDLQRFAAECRLPPKTSFALQIIVEEMALYTHQHLASYAYIDLLIKSRPADVTLDFRSIGSPFNPLKTAAEDFPENIKLLNGMADKVEHAYVLGLNSTRFTLRRRD